MKNIINISKCLTHTIDDRWVWTCNIWFNKKLFSDCIIKSSSGFESEKDALNNLKSTLTKLGLNEKM